MAMNTRSAEKMTIAGLPVTVLPSDSNLMAVKRVKLAWIQREFWGATREEQIANIVAEVAIRFDITQQSLMVSCQGVFE